MRYKLTTIFCLVIVALFVFTGASQASVVKMDKKALTNKAEEIVEGTVVRTTFHWNSDHTNIFTSVIIRVEDRLKGNDKDAEIEVVVPGGRVGDVNEWVSDTPCFQTGENVMLFLKQENGRRKVIGGDQGKLVIVDKKIGNFGLDEFKNGVRNVMQNLPWGDEILATASKTGEPIITNVTPASAPAGTGMLITISGSGFGTTQGKVCFYYQDNVSYFVPGSVKSWGDTQIVTEVPVFTDNDGYPGSACSGPMYVERASDHIQSNKIGLSVPFSYGGANWPSSSTVNYFINPNCPDCTGEETAVQAGANTWNAATDSFRLNYAGATPATSSSKNSVCTCAWGSLDLETIALTNYWWNTGSWITECDITFNDIFKWSTASSPATGSYDVQTIATHEFGHWLNLRDLYGDTAGFVQDKDKVMYGYGSTGQSKRVLTSGDQKGIQYIYPVQNKRDLFFSSFSLNGVTSAICGTDIIIQNTVYNTGAAAAPGFPVNYYLSTDETISTSDVYLGQRYISSLAAGASNQASSILKIPSVSSGNYYIGAVIDPTNSVVEINENNNTRSAPILIAVPKIDLVVNAIDGPTSGMSGDSLYVTDNVRNLGNVTAAGVTVRYYLSADAAITTSDTLLGQRYISSLAGGAISEATTSVSIPYFVAAGSYYLGAYVDPLNVHAEGNEANNTRLDTAKINILNRDLAVSVFAGPSSALTGNKINVTDKVQNVGNGTATGFYVKYYLSANTSITNSDVYLGQRYISSLAGGASNSATTSIPIPLTVGPGSYYLGAFADAVNTVPEPNEANNTRLSATKIYIAVGTRDLYLSAFDGPTSALTGNKINVTDTVKNRSNGIAYGTEVRYYLSTDATITTGDIYLGRRSIASVAGYGTSTGIISLTIPSTVQAGTYYLGAFVDPFNTVKESNEFNNTRLDTAKITITVGTRDLAISAFDGPTSGTKGAPISLTDTIKNSGNGTAYTFYVKYYLTTNTTSTASYVFLGQRYISSLAGGASSTVATSVSIPLTVSGGSYYLIAVVDPTKTVTETNEKNNIRIDTAKITIE